MRRALAARGRAAPRSSSPGPRHGGRRGRGGGESRPPRPWRRPAPP